MTTQTEALKLALEALENTTPTGFNMESDNRFYAAITAIKEALAQPEQEPFGYFRYDMRLDAWVMNREGQRPGTPFYTIPPQRTWVGLDDDEMLMIYGQQHEGKKYSLGRMVEAKLKEKNK